jgi:deoxyribonuclease-4
MSIAGGVDLALERGAAVGCDAIQMFNKSSNQWKAKPLAAEEVGRFRSMQIEKGISPVVSHGCYLVNLASPDPAMYRRSVEAFGVEIDRCETLGIPYLVTHPGSHMGAGEEEGLARVRGALDELLDARPGGRVMILLETTAGQGHCVGHRFEHLRTIMDASRHPGRIGVCVDTCHIFAAGYDLRTPSGYDAVMRELDRTVGLSRVAAFHLNDSKKDLGCRVDRHEHIGKGFLGVEAFRCLMNDARFEGIPMLLETPKGADCAEDRVNLALLRSLVGARDGKATGQRSARPRARARAKPRTRTRR